MGTIRNYYKCDVCGTVTLLRTQYGWLDQHPVRFNCGQCGILISGNAYLDQEKARFDMKLDNATIVSKPIKIDYYIEASGELLTEKLKEFEVDSMGHMIPPFFKGALFTFHDPNNPDKAYERLQDFQGSVMSFLNNAKTSWAKVRRINELWLNNQKIYLIQEVHKLLPQKQFPMNNDLECLRGVHSLTRLFFQPLLKDKENKIIFDKAKNILDSNPGQLLELAKFFKDDFAVYEKRILKIFEKYVQCFRFLIPVYSLRYYNQIDPNIYQEKGITTASFEDLKELYNDTYEVAASLLDFVVAYNNVIHRERFDVMPENLKITLEQFRNSSKGKKIEFIVEDESFSELIEDSSLDNKLRNGIGHNTYEVDGINQLIKYDPVGKGNPNDIREIYLVQFAQKCLSLFQTIINLWELLYLTNKHYYVSLGYIGVDPRVFDNDKKQMDPNEARRKKNVKLKKKRVKNKRR